MTDGDPIAMLRELLTSYDQRAELLAHGDAELQQQRTQAAEQTATLQALVNQVEATTQHLAELQRELAVLRGELSHEDHRLFTDWPYVEATSARWSLIDVLKLTSGRLAAWSDISAKLFQPQSARAVMLQSAKLLKAQHDLLVGARGGS